MERATAYAAATRMVQGLSGLLLLVSVAAKLLPDQQGDFITMSSLVQVQAAAELGLTTVLVQVASHLSHGRLAKREDLALADHAVWERLGPLIGASFSWMAMLSAAFLVLLLPFGWWFFAGVPRTVQGPWTLAVVATALNLLPIPLLAIREGTGGVAAAWRIRLLQQGAWGLTMVLGLLCGAGCWALGLAALAALVAGGVGLLGDGGVLLGLWRRRRFDRGLAEMQEVWPFQWRVSLSYLSGVFITNVSTPSLYRLCGEIDAGRFGLSVNAMRAVSSVALAVVSAKAQRLGTLVSTGAHEELDRSFDSACRRSLLLGGIGLALVVLGLPLAGVFWHHAQGRALEGRSLLVLACAMFLNHAVQCLAVYLRAHREEPLLVPSLLGAGAIGFGVPLVAAHWGVLGVCYWTFVVTLILGLGAATVLVHRRRRSRPAATAAPATGGAP